MNELDGKFCVLNRENTAGTLSDDMIMWEYECHRCKSTFKVPVPRGPSEEKQIKCPQCGSMDITRETIESMDPVFCGG